MPQDPTPSPYRDRTMAALGRLSGEVAHDFNNLLGALILNLESLEILVEPDGEAAELVAACLQAALHGTDMTRRLYAFSSTQPPLPPDGALTRIIADLLPRTPA